MISRWFEKCRMLRVLVITQIEMPENTMEQNAKEAWAELIFAHHFRAWRLISRRLLLRKSLGFSLAKNMAGEKSQKLSIFIRYKKCMCEKSPVRLLFYEGGTKCRRGWLWHVNTRQCCNPLLTNFLAQCGKNYSQCLHSILLSNTPVD